MSYSQQLTHSRTPQNDRPKSATGVQVADTLPANVTFDSAIPSQGTCSPPSSGVVNCALGTLAAGANATISIKVRPQAEGSITNSAAISSAITESDPSDNSASAETTVSPAADLTLTDADSPDPVPAGQLLIYTLTAQNAGPSSATGVQLTDTLPAGVTYESAVPTQGACNEASCTVDCALGTIASGQQATVEIKVRPQTEGSLTNDASVSSSVFDPVSADNSASEETTVGPAADLSLSKTDSPDPVRAGELLTYTLTIQNDGPSGATNVQLVDNLPAGVTYDSATPSQGSCSEIGATVTCPLGAPAGRGCDHQQRDRLRGRVRSGHGRQLRERRDHGRSGRRHLAH